MKVTTIRLDVPKNVFQVHGVGEDGTVVLRKQLKRDLVARLFASLVSITEIGSGRNWLAKNL